MSESQLNVMSVFIRKEGNLFSFTVGGLMNDKETHCTLCYAYGLEEGDEVTIERKNIEQSSPPVTMPCIPCKEPPEEASRQRRLTLFRELEAALKAKGLI
jgi:hypothetical protein